MSQLIERTDKGLYVPAADVHIDPWRGVDRALLTHGHADHARSGSASYLCTTAARPVIQHRLSRKKGIEAVDYGETVQINGVQFSFHPAGHIPGSAQIRVEYTGEVWVVSGDYKTTDDGFSEPFESVRCHTFITESTFGLPAYRWPDQRQVFHDIDAWWAANAAEGRVSILCGYSLGKAQRLLSGIDTSIGPIFVHPAVDRIDKILAKQGYDLPATHKLSASTKKETTRGALVVVPPAALDSKNLSRLGTASTAMASGWMALRGARRRGNYDRGFVLSDHADWDGLNHAVAETGAERVLVTHGYAHTFAKWLREQGARCPRPRH